MISTITSIAILFSIPISANNINQRVKLIPSGENYVFKMNTKGVVVTGTYDVVYENKTYNPINNDIKKGDIIVEANSQKVTNINDLSEVIKESSSIELKIKRNNNLLSRKLNIYKVNNISRSGLYVKDRVIGVGTITYIDPKNMVYGGLGHEVIDNDTKKIVDFSSGEIYYNEVISISKGTNMHPGEKVSNTLLKEKIGDIQKNSFFGMFGKYYKSVKSSKEYEVAYKNEIKKAEAKILTCVKGDKVKSYDVIITDLKKQDENGTKGITFKITDPELISIAGGVYSGMSGSPIIQNNRIIGAVTHVLVDNIQYGYGIYIDNMYNKQIS